MNRRQFLKTTAIITGGVLTGLPHSAFPSNPPADLVLVKNGLPAAMVGKALELLGGIKRFVSKGERVLLKPNLSWDRTPEYAATTNPELVAEVVRQCYQAGAANVLILDNTCNDARRSYTSCRIPEYAEKYGAEVRFVRDNQFIETPIPNSRQLKSWLIHQEVFKVDKIINLPILKQHGTTQITMGFKNVMGLIGGNRGRIHRPFAENIVDLNRVIVANLTILDAYRVLRRNGPSGGNLEDVDQLNTLIAGTDRVLVDAWGAKIFGIAPQTLPYLQLANAEGMGEINTDKFRPVVYDF